MKVKKLLVIAVVMAVAGGAQAVLYWGGGANPGGGDSDWNNNLSWWNGAAWDGVPAAGETLYIDKYFAGSAADTSTWIPTLDTAGAAGNVVLSVHAAAEVQVSQLNLVNGALLDTDNMQMGAGAAINSTNTLDMTGNATMTVGGLWLGSLAAGTVNTINMSDTSSATVEAGLWWGQDNGNGTGAVVMDGGASLTILGALDAAPGWENTRITALNTVGGDYIQRTDLGTGWIEYTVIPEPATFGMVALFGGGLLWIRKRLII